MTRSIRISRRELWTAALVVVSAMFVANVGIAAAWPTFVDEVVRRAVDLTAMEGMAVGLLAGAVQLWSRF